MNARDEIEKAIKKEFYEAYPLCFPEPPLCGFYIGEGWKPLVKTLCTDIHAELEKLPENMRNFQVDQVKEKFAGLRFYYSGPVPDDGLIEVEVPEEVIQKLAYENWQWRVEHDIKGSAEYDWIRAENSAYVKAILEAYPQELKDARERIKKLISEAESASFKICDGCGAPGTVRGDGWIRTQCDACEKEAKRQRALDERKHIIRRRAWKNAGTDGNEIDWRDWRELSEEKKIAYMNEAEKQLLKEGGIKSVDRY